MKTLDNLRKEIDQLDEQIMELLNKRYDITNQIGKIKQIENLEVTNNERELDVISKTYDYKHQIAIANVYKKIMEVSKDLQKYASYLLCANSSYTYSPLIHKLLGNEYYIPVEGVSLEEFVLEDANHFKGINITNPYKSSAYEYLINNNYELDEYALNTKTVNFVLKDKDTLKGYNTDYLGFKGLLEYNHINLTSKNILVLGNGSTSKTVLAVLKEYNLKNVDVAVRTKRNEKEIYLNEVNNLDQYDYVINTTSYGVYPNLELSSLIPGNLNPNTIIIDVNYNPNRSILSISNPNNKYINGLYMLVEQARLAEELIQNKTIDVAINKEIINEIQKNNLNICLIGMPFSGKTTIGEKLSAKLNKTFYDSDIILKEENLSLSKLLSLGLTLEDYRYYESSVIETLATVPNCIISTGGGVIENPDNIMLLKQNGLIVFIDTPLETLSSRIKNDRPLVKNSDDLKQLFNKRYESYKKNSDIIINGNQDIDSLIQELEVKLNEYFSN